MLRSFLWPNFTVVRWLVVVLAAVVLASTGTALADDLSRDDDARLRRDISRLETLLAEIQAEMRSLAGTADSKAAIEWQNDRITTIRESISRMQAAARTMGQTRADLNATRTAIRNREHETDESAGEKAGKAGAKQVGKWLVGQVARRILRQVGVVADITESMAYMRIRNATARDLTEMIAGETERIALLNELIVASELELEEQQAQLARLLELREEGRQVAAALYSRRRFLAPAVKDALLTRDRDPASDAAEIRKQTEDLNRPRPEIRITWATYPRWMEDTHAVFVCPPNPDRSFATVTLYGSLRYSIEAPICVAAAHAGVITPEAGGRVILQVFDLDRGGISVPFTGSLRNGIRSHSWGDSASSRSFIPRAAVGVRVTEALR